MLGLLPPVQGHHVTVFAFFSLLDLSWAHSLFVVMGDDTIGDS
jgi:hypothetical protein